MGIESQLFSDPSVCDTCTSISSTGACKKGGKQSKIWSEDKPLTLNLAKPKRVNGESSGDKQGKGRRKGRGMGGGRTSTHTRENMECPLHSTCPACVEILGLRLVSTAVAAAAEPTG